jgi:hypothetical protein
MTNELAAATYVKDLGDGLIARWSTAADIEKIGLLLSTIHRSSADEPLNVRSQDLPCILMGSTFPYMGAGDFAVVEDTRQPTQPIVACTCFWRHQWSSAGIPIGVGRPEYVATDPAYRNRGLVRTLFAMFHARSAAEGHLLQGITGIPYFYRQFGYEYALDLGGTRTTYFSLIPEKKGDEPEPYHLRPATPADIPQLTAFYNQRRPSSLLWHEATPAYWQFMTSFWDDPAVRARDATTLGWYGRYHMLVRQDNTVVGSVWLGTRRWGRSLDAAPELSLAPEVNRQEIVPVLLRALRTQGLQTPGVAADTPPCSEIIWQLGRSHPFYDLLGEALAPRVEPPYAWYVRIADVPAFLWRIAPVLEERLARSSLAGYTGDLKLDFYRGGLALRFAQGKLNQAAPWRPPTYGDEAGAGSPALTFLQLLLSYRNLDELRAIYPDVWANDNARVLLDTLFPKQRSMVEPLG